MKIKSYLTIILVLTLKIMLATPQIMTINDQCKQSEKLNVTEVVKQLNSGERGDDITFGPEYIFSLDNIAYCSAGTLDSNHFVVAYTNDYSYAVVGTIDGDIITYGEEYLFNDGDVTSYASEYISVAVLDSTRFVIAYSDRGDSYSNYGTVILGTLTGDTISYSAEYVFNSSSTMNTSSTTLDSGHFVVAYDESDGGKSIVGTVSGNSISFGSENAFNTILAGGISTTTLNPSKFIVCYYDEYSEGKAVVGSVSGNTISYGSETTFSLSNSGEPIATTTMDENSFVVAYLDRIKLGNVSGNNISFGTELLFCPYQHAEFFSIATLDSAKFVITYKLRSQYGGKAAIGTIADNNLFLSQEVFYTQQVINVQSVTSLNPNEFVVVFNEYSPEDYGIGILGNVSEKPIFTTIQDTLICIGTDSISVPVGIVDMQNVTEFSLLINYDNTNLAFVNCVNLNSQLNSGQLTAIDDNGEITISWESDTSAFILNSDTLFELQFSIPISDSSVTGNLLWDEANSYYQKSNGEFSVCNFEDGQIITLVPEKPQGPVFIDLDDPVICEYTTNTVENAISYQWVIEPSTAGLIFGSDTIGTIGWNVNYTGLTAYVYVIATTVECGPASSDSLEVSLSPVGLQELSENDLEVELFPNPGNGKFNLLFKKPTNNLSIKIINSKGEKVHEERLNISNTNYQHQMDLSSYQPGVYFVQLITENSTAIKKLILK